MWGPPQAGALATRLLPTTTVPQARTLCRGATCGVPPRPGPRPPACAPLPLCPKPELSARGKLWGPPQAGAPDQALRAYAGSLTPRCVSYLSALYAAAAPRGFRSLLQLLMLAQRVLSERLNYYTLDISSFRPRRRPTLEIYSGAMRHAARRATCAWRRARGECGRAVDRGRDTLLEARREHTSTKTTARRAATPGRQLYHRAQINAHRAKVLPSVCKSTCRP